MECLRQRDDAPEQLVAPTLLFRYGPRDEDELPRDGINPADHGLSTVSPASSSNAALHFIQSGFWNVASGSFSGSGYSASTMCLMNCSTAAASAKETCTTP